MAHYAAEAAETAAAAATSTINEAATTAAAAKVASAAVTKAARSATTRETANLGIRTGPKDDKASRADKNSSLRTTDDN
jgi:hypothetical protein